MSVRVLWRRYFLFSVSKYLSVQKIKLMVPGFLFSFLIAEIIQLRIWVALRKENCIWCL